MNKAIIVGSITYAQRAKRALAAQGIGARIVKSDSQREDAGCVYGVEIPEGRYLDAIALLKRSGLYRSEV